MGELARFILFFGEDEEEERKKRDESDKVDVGRVDYMKLRS